MTLGELARVPWRKVTSFHMDQLRAARGGKCERCGGRWSLAKIPGKGLRHRPLEFAHVKPTGLSGRGRGLAKRFFDVIRHPDCYRLLCRKCHWIIDADAWVAEQRRETTAVSA